jgi:hypothetical protein
MTATIVGLVCFVLGAGGVLVCVWLAMKRGIPRPLTAEKM